MTKLVTDNALLAAFCQQARNRPVLAVDTEFIRQSTFYPKLGLIQLYDGEQLALVDPLAISQWQPLQDLFADTAVTKVLHSCNEDIDALATLLLEKITPLFDTQMAAELLGWGSSIGYARLVEKLTGEVLDKGESRTDWLARPLTEKQLKYAADDVHFLLPVYQHIAEQLDVRQLTQLLLAEGQQLIQRRKVSLPPYFRYLEIKNGWLLGSRDLAVLRELSSWRQEYAVKKDLAIGLVLKDFQLLELAKRKPATAESLLNIPGIQSRDIRRHARTLTELIEVAKLLPPEQCPQTFYHLQQFAGFKAESARLGQAVKQAADETGIPAEFLSVKRQLNEYLNWCWRVSDEERLLLPLPEYLSNWRKEHLLPYLPVPEHVKEYLV